MAFTKITAAGIGSTETVTLDGLSVINDGSFGGNLSVGGTLTYEDVTNIDSVGLITARAGVVVGSGITLSKDGDIFATGITTVSGNIKVGTGITLSPDGDGFFTGVVTATTFKGDGSQLSNVTSTTINNNADNRLITGSGTANTLNGESALTFDGSTMNFTAASGDARLTLIGTEGNDARISLVADDGDDHIDQYNIESRASDNSFRIDQFSGGSRVDRLSIDSDASGGNVTVHTGNLVIGTSGKGIDFSAQTATSASGASATSEILDHYEEGTWTPTLTTSNGGSYSASYVYGYYTRIGRIVHAHFAFNSYGNQSTDLLGSGSTSDNVTGGGLPFPTAPGGQEYYQGDIGFYALNFPSSLSTGTLNLYAYIGSDTTSFSFKLPRDNAASQQIQVGQFGQGYIRGCFHYLTS